MKKSISLLCTKSTLGSGSLKAIVETLQTTLHRKIWRTTKEKSPPAIQFKYGDLKNKVYQYKWFTDNAIPCPPFTQDKKEAQEWAKSGTVVCRTLLNASEGRGITLADTPAEIIDAKVYTKYIKKKREFRVHVFKDTIISIKEKKKRVDWEDPRETKIRNLANGYIFCEPTEELPENLGVVALQASKVTASDFKGVDIAYNAKHNYIFVLEVNSAPGIQGSNVAKYCEEMVKCL